MRSAEKVTWQVDWHKPRTAVIANHQGTSQQGAIERLEQLVRGVVKQAVEDGEASVTIRVARAQQSTPQKGA
jgi:hypothetical protein